MGATLKAKRDTEGQGWLSEESTEFAACEALVDKLKALESTEEMIVDLFAGGGGASHGIFMATGKHPHAAVNHDREAILMHSINHPDTVHYVSDIRGIIPWEVTKGRPVGLLWASPDCKHFSKAKGGTPVEKEIRDLAWVVPTWAQTVRPRVICLENVEEFITWCPLVEKVDKITGLVVINPRTGKPMMEPDASKKGETFTAWVDALKRCGYAVEWKELVAANYGVPTTRKRLFVIARCDGLPIVWPEPTHSKGGAGGLLPWRSAAECIDWKLPTRSIFGRPRPLAHATMARIAKGIERFVLNNPRPFLVPLTHQGAPRVYDIDDPFRTVTAAHRGEVAIVEPVMAPTTNGVGGRAGQSRPRSVEEPAATITSKADTVLTVTHMAPYGVPRYGEREGQEPRTNDIQEPMPTVVTTGNGFQLCSAFMAQHNGGFNTTPGHPLEAPVSTICQSGANQQLVTSHLMIQRRNAFGRSMEEPSPTSTAHTNHLHAVTGHLEVMRNNANGQDVQEPAPTVCAQGTHLSVVLSFLTSFYGTGLGQDCRAPLRTVTTCDRFGVVTAHAAVEIDGQTYALSDIHMRMLAPRELYLAQGFPPEYVIDPILDGKPLTKTAQVRMCGNSVCPGLAAAIVSANYQPLEMQVAA